MKRNDALEIIDCLPDGETRFYYFKDRYALLLLSLTAGEAVMKRELTKSSFGRLLDKSVVKAALGQYREGVVSSDVFAAHWPIDYECYFLTLGLWGSRDRWCDQTSRSGYNLVLQLNFSSKHDEPYRRLIDPEEQHPFEFSGHPISRGKRRTLAWSRIDIDLASGEALIEEIHNDWIRFALQARKRADHTGGAITYFGLEIRTDNIVRYFDHILRPHAKFWDEAMLSTTIWFLREELGVKTIYYHTHESGAALKRISYRLPPKSLYTKLPRRFCFAETSDRPGFLPKKGKNARSRKTLEQARFQVMSW